MSLNIVKAGYHAETRARNTASLMKRERMHSVPFSSVYFKSVRPEHSVAGITQTRHYITVAVELFVHDA